MAGVRSVFSEPMARSVMAPSNNLPDLEGHRGLRTCVIRLGLKRKTKYRFDGSTAFHRRLFRRHGYDLLKDFRQGEWLPSSIGALGEQRGTKRLELPAQSLDAGKDIGERWLWREQPVFLGGGLKLYLVFIRHKLKLSKNFKLPAICAVFCV
jgi:hypothetical protein